MWPNGDMNNGALVPLASPVFPAAFGQKSGRPDHGGRSPQGLRTRAIAPIRSWPSLLKSTPDLMAAGETAAKLDGELAALRVRRWWKRLVG